MPYTSVNPSVHKTPTTSNYISSVTILDEIHKPEIDSNFIDRYGSQSMTGLMELIGNVTPVSQETYSHFEEDFLHHSIKVKDEATVAALVDTDKGYRFAIDQTGYDADKTDQYYIRLNNIVEFANGQVGMIVAYKNKAEAAVALSGYTPTFDAGTTELQVIVILYDEASADAGGLTAIKGANAILTGLEFAEMTDQPEGLTPNLIKYENGVMIMKESFRVSGSEATNMTWMEVPKKDGGVGYAWFLKGEKDTFNRMMNYTEIQMMNGHQAGATLKALGMRGTEGLLKFAKGGNYQTYTKGATPYGVTEFKALIRKLDKSRGSRENSIWCGRELSMGIDDTMVDKFSTAGAKFGDFVGSAEQMAQLGFESIAYGGFKFHKKVHEAFTNPEMLGTEGFNYAHSGLLIPMDTQIDPKRRKPIPSLAIRYKELEGNSRKMEHWLTGGAILENKTNENDSMKSNYRTERGFEGFANNRFAWIEGV